MERIRLINSSCHIPEHLGAAVDPGLITEAEVPDVPLPGAALDAENSSMTSLVSPMPWHHFYRSVGAVYHFHKQTAGRGLPLKRHAEDKPS